MTFEYNTLDKHMAVSIVNMYMKGTVCTNTHGEEYN